MFELRNTVPDGSGEMINRCVLALTNICAVTGVSDAELRAIARKVNSCEVLRGWGAVDVVEACLLEKDGRKATYAVVVVSRTLEGVTNLGQPCINHDNEAYQLFLADLGMDPGHLLIRPETLADKVAELFGSIDVDFSDHPEFSKKYFTLAATPDDESRFRENAGSRFLDTIAAREGLHIEVQDGTIAVMTERSINLEDATMLTEFIMEVQGNRIAWPSR